ncbi:hypothetical protein ACOMHN_002234 [Nucella lapillus]
MAASPGNQTGVTDIISTWQASVLTMEPQGHSPTHGYTMQQYCNNWGQHHAVVPLPWTTGTFTYTGAAPCSGPSPLDHRDIHLHRGSTMQWSLSPGPQGHSPTQGQHHAVVPLPWTTGTLTYTGAAPCSGPSPLDHRTLTYTGAAPCSGPSPLDHRTLTYTGAAPCSGPSPLDHRDTHLHRGSTMQ